MTPPRPRLVVTIPARTAAEARRSAEEARADGSDMAEIRLDRWAEDELDQIPALFPSPLPLIGTYRSRTEGGEGSDDGPERARVLTEVARHPFAFLDVELARDLPLDGRLAGELNRSSAPRLIASRHAHPRPTPAEFGGFWARERPATSVGKLVFVSRVGELVGDFLPLLPPAPGGPYVVHTTGGSAELLRALGWRLGMELTFCAPGSTRPVESVQPGQIPVDRLAHYLAGDAPGPLFAVVGHPVARSRSPTLHSRWMRAAGLHGLYLGLEVRDSTELAAALPALGALGFRGLNVTHPLKVAGLALASEATPTAERAGCANSLSWEGSEIVAENTDVAAMDQRLAELRGRFPSGIDRVTVLGAGGAARAVLTVLSERGWDAEIIARNPASAGALAREFGFDLRDVDSGRPAQLLVHATPAGTVEVPTLDLPLDRLLGADSYVLDYVVEPHHRFLEQETVSRGGTYEDGTRLLEYQAAESYAVWWGRYPPGWTDVTPARTR